MAKPLFHSTSEKQALQQGLIGIDDFARMHGVSRHLVDCWLHTQRLPYRTVGKRRFIEIEAKVPYYQPRSHRGSKRAIAWSPVENIQPACGGY